MLFYTALEGFDYVAMAYTKSFPIGSMNSATLCVNITIVDDEVLEENQEFFVSLSTKDPGVILESSETIITIMDNDS